MGETPSLSLIIILLLGLLKVGEIRAQCGPPLFANMLLTEDSPQGNFYDGITVKLKCSVGYQGQGGGSRDITCKGNQWTPPQFQCQKKSCGSPGEISNGRYLIPDGILFGATATAQCNEGYMIVGQVKTRNCLDNGWDGRVAECEAVKCKQPDTIPNGEFDPVMDSYDYNEAVTYTCSGGYTLDGSETVTCSTDGSFGPSPKCVWVVCEKPNIANAEKIEGKSVDFKYRDFVRYKCKDGFIMSGSDHLVCDIKGWNPPPPVCTAKTGPKPVPTPGPNPGPTLKPPPVEENNTARNVGIGVGVGVVGLLVLIGLGYFFMQRSKRWGKVPTRNEGGE